MKAYLRSFWKAFKDCWRSLPAFLVERIDAFTASLEDHNKFWGDRLPEAIYCARRRYPTPDHVTSRRFVSPVQSSPQVYAVSIGKEHLEQSVEGIVADEQLQTFEDYDRMTRSIDRCPPSLVVRTNESKVDAAFFKFLPRR